VPRSPVERPDAEILGYFDEDFPSARAHFMAVCAGHGVECAEVAIAPGRGTLVVAEFGPRQATTKLVVLSGLHGVEAYAGSATQIALLHGLAGRSGRVHVILVHGINPLGAAAYQRTNPDNIDLNRNLVDDHATLARVDARSRAVGALFSDPPLARLPDGLWLPIFLWRVIRLGGMRALKAAFAGGQFFDPAAPFFGGRQIAPEVMTLLKVLKPRLAHADPAATILFDLHSGIGGARETSLMENGPTTAPLTAIFGVPIVDAHGGDGAVYPARGDVVRGLKTWLGLDDAAGVTFECGTGPALSTLLALRAANSARIAPPPSEGGQARIRERMLAAFCPHQPKWRTTYVRHATALLLRAFNHLSEEALSHVPERAAPPVS